ncbi:uncharacterized protein FOMMEDRAFT_162126 [Fomitiporia mediterranea MF3/22]|uniref:uncharacterized protein n=1 Tax=Fomitiporia mediterranea (strain MF3/22) TaxID=694068 RepID=UPI000440930D|nr:uncharacterized protein FOMMEDRAFT_162126 [Fomitiporia mediterranea MF3/22]EJC98328.1 hypothetical protein FOMMEDRAFT_162126 [Fomitiporia mediterranea MF3/22]
MHPLSSAAVRYHLVLPIKGVLNVAILPVVLKVAEEAPIGVLVDEVLVFQRIIATFTEDDVTAFHLRLVLLSIPLFSVDDRPLDSVHG